MGTATQRDGFFFRHLALAAFRAASLRSLFVRDFARAFPPFRPPRRPRETAAGFLVEPSEVGFADACSFAASSAIWFESELVESLEEPLSADCSSAAPSAVVCDWLPESLEVFSSGGCSLAAPSAVEVGDSWRPSIPVDDRFSLLMLIRGLLGCRSRRTVIDCLLWPTFLVGDDFAQPHHMARSGVCQGKRTNRKDPDASALHFQPVVHRREIPTGSKLDDERNARTAVLNSPCPASREKQGQDHSPILGQESKALRFRYPFQATPT